MSPERMFEAVIGGVLPGRTIGGSADDHHLASGCAAGDAAAFEEIYRRHGQRMKSIARAYLGSIPDAEDAVQESFLKIHRAAGTFTGEASLPTWIQRIVVNTCLDVLRRRKRRIEETAIEEETASRHSAATVDDAKRMTLRKLLDELPEQRRSVFTLFEIEGLSHAEIAAILGITEGHSKWILFATKKDLQEKWLQREKGHPAGARSPRSAGQSRKTPS